MNAERAYPEWIWWFPEGIPLKIEETTVIIDTGYPRFLARLKRACTPETVWRTPLPGNMDSYYERRTSINGHPIREGWRVPRDIFEREFQGFQQAMAAERQRWDATPDVWKLVYVLRETFRRNLRAHANQTRPARWAAFDKKNDLLWKATRYARTVDLPGFTWGKQDDPAVERHPTILYFQFNDAQVSFHCNINGEGENPVPDFPGQWNGLHQTECPITIALIKRMVAGHESTLIATPDNYPPLVTPEQLVEMLTPKTVPVLPVAIQPVPSPKPVKRFKTLLDYMHTTKHE